MKGLPSRQPIRLMMPSAVSTCVVGNESPAAAGDSFPTTQVLTADGIISLIGCLLGNPFINAVYIGHPGWKAMGGRIGYSAATGVMVLVLTWLGIVALVSSLI